ncbi:MAG TPA: divergent polysaccharide deacetylase family protein [Alphaproteobacteria bacterium]|nr:divergent polysaccharide deacetylase family protein [Alphaproteobacteria bacterium]
MTNFQQQLDDEMQKRGLKQLPEASEQNAAVENKSLFSWGAFAKGLFLDFLVVAALAGWAYYKADETLHNIQARLPSKTAIINYEDMPVNIKTSDVQPVLNMGHPSPVTTEKPILNSEAEQAFIKEAEESAEAQDIEETSTQKEIEPPSAVSENPEPVVTPVDNIAKNTKGMVPAPVPGLYENTPAGTIPQIRQEDGLTAFKAYKHPFIKQGDKPVLSIVITDLGLSQKTTETVIEKFPDVVTLAFSPYAPDLKNLVKKTRDNGHEAWLMLPLETQNFPLNDPGPLTLLSNASTAKNQDRLNQLMASADGYVGFISPADHAFSAEDANINPAIKEIFARGLAVFDGKTSSQSFVKQIAEKEGYPYAKNDFWLDDDLSPLALNQSLRKAIEHAQATGSATLMLHPYPASIKALEKFLDSETLSQFQLAPASATVTYGY